MHGLDVRSVCCARVLQTISETESMMERGEHEYQEKDLDGVVQALKCRRRWEGWRGRSRGEEEGGQDGHLTVMYFRSQGGKRTK